MPLLDAHRVRQAHRHSRRAGHAGVLAGDAAIAVSGASAGAIATALRAALDEPALAKNLSEARKKRLATIRIVPDGRCIIDAVAALSRSACAGAHVTG